MQRDTREGVFYERLLDQPGWEHTKAKRERVKKRVLTDVPAVTAPDGTALEASAERLAETIRAEMKDSGTIAAFCMPQYGSLAPNDLLGIERSIALKELVPTLHAVGIADPLRTTPDERKQMEGIVAKGQVKALKCYLGYVACNAN